MWSRRLRHWGGLGRRFTEPKLTGKCLSSLDRGPYQFQSQVSVGAASSGEMLTAMKGGLAHLNSHRTVREVVGRVSDLPARLRMHVVAMSDFCRYVVPNICLHFAL